MSNEGDEGAVGECSAKREEEGSEEFDDEEDSAGRGHVDVDRGTKKAQKNHGSSKTQKM